MTRRKVILPYWTPSKEDASNKEALNTRFEDLSQGEIVINNNAEGSYLTILDSNDNPSTFDSSKVADAKISESFESATTFTVSAITETKAELTTALSEAKEELTSAITETKSDMPIVKGDVENSAVLKGGNNRALGKYATAFGGDNDLLQKKLMIVIL